MSHLRPVLVRLPQGIADEVIAHCAGQGLRISEFLRALVIEACREGLGSGHSRHLSWIENDLNFAAVALDALLAGHADPDLRARAHAAFARKAERRHGDETAFGGEGA